MPIRREVHFVSTVNLKPDRARIWGFFVSRKHAEDAIQYNETDMFELGYYKYGVVYTMSEGLLQVGEDETWFEYHKNGTVTRVEKPAGINHLAFTF